MTGADMRQAAPPTQDAAAQAQAAAAPEPAPRPVAEAAPPQGLPAGSPSSGFRMPPHGPAYQAMHAMLQRRREQLQKLQQEAAAGSGTARAAFALGPPCLSMPHTVEVAIAAAGSGAQGSSVASEPLQPMLSV